MSGLQEKIMLVENRYKKQKLPEFQVGDTVRVLYRIKEGKKERLQPFEGVVISKKGGKRLWATFTVRKISSGIGVERTFPLYSPKIAELKVVRRGKVRRAKLYYLRGRSGKAARIKERKG